MSDTFTTLLNLRLQQTGGNDNTWGDLLNTDAIQVLENAIAAATSRAVTGGSLDLSATPLQSQVQIFTGILVSNETVTIPNLSKRMLVINNTTGAFVLLMKTSAGTAVEIPQGCAVDVYCDGANTIYRHDRKEVGQIAYFGGTSVPGGWMECDGTSLVRTDHPDLFTAISTTWGSADGTHFTLPDFKTAGRFLRSRTGSVTAGTLQAADIAAHNHAASGTFTGTLINYTPAGSVSVSTPSGSVSTSLSNGTGVIHLGTGLNPTTLGTGFGSSDLTATSTFTGNAASGSFSGTAASFTPAGSVAVTVSNSSGTETRPINASALCCIKL